MVDKQPDKKGLSIKTLERIVFSAGLIVGGMNGLLMHPEAPLLSYFVVSLPFVVPCFLTGYIVSREVKRPLTFAAILYGGNLVGETAVMLTQYSLSRL
jgi:hypothetical protein